MACTERGGRITFSDTTTSDSIFYQPVDFVGYPHVQGLYSRTIEFSPRQLLYIAGLFRKVASGFQFDYAHKFTRNIAANMSIKLPVIGEESRELDLTYMEAYIRELEAARIRELEKWLIAAGLNDCILTPDEEKALKDWQTKKVPQKAVKISDLFFVETPKRRFNANAVKFGGAHPYVVRTSLNNGRRGTIVADEIWLNPGNTISFGQDTATIFYQGEPYFTGDKIKVMRFRHGEFDERIACFLLAVMRKSFSTFTWGTSSFDEKVLKAVKVSVPITDANSIDIEFMSLFIRAIIKRTIRGVVAWKDREIAATKKVVAR